MLKKSIPPTGDVTALLVRWQEGNRQALPQIIELVYTELHQEAKRMIHRYPSPESLQPTAIINEVFIRLDEDTRIHFPDRAHFFSFSSKLIRNILIDHIRMTSSHKRGGNMTKVVLIESESPPVRNTLEPEMLLDLDKALNELANFDPRQSRLIELRFFGGLQIMELADCFGISITTVKRELKMARSWLARKLTNPPAPESDVRTS